MSDVKYRTLYVSWDNAMKIARHYKVSHVKKLGFSVEVEEIDIGEIPVPNKNIIYNPHWAHSTIQHQFEENERFYRSHVNVKGCTTTCFRVIVWGPVPKSQQV